MKMSATHLLPALLWACLLGLVLANPNKAMLERFSLEKYPHQSGMFYTNVFNDARGHELGIKGTLESLKTLSRQKKHQKMKQLVEVSELSEAKCNQRELDNIANLIERYEANTINLVPYLKHFYGLQKMLCKSKLKEEIPKATMRLTPQVERVLATLAKVYESKREFYDADRIVDLLAAYLGAQISLEQAIESGSVEKLSRLIGAKLKELDDSCGAVRDVFSGLLGLTKAADHIGKIDLDELDVKIWPWVQSHRLCRSLAYLKIYQADASETFKHQLYSAESPIWQSADDTVTEWRRLKQELYSPSAQPGDTAGKLHRLVEIQVEGLLGKFSSLVTSYEEDLCRAKQLSAERCKSTFPEDVIVLFARHERSPIVIDYLKQHERSQLRLCLSMLDQLDQNSVLYQYDGENRRTLRKVMSYYEGERVGKHAFSGSSLVVAIRRYLKNGNQADDEGQMEKLSNLKNICANMRNDLYHVIKMAEIVDDQDRQTLGESNGDLIDGVQLCNNIIWIEDIVESSLSDRSTPSGSPVSSSGSSFSSM